MAPTSTWRSNKPKRSMWRLRIYVYDFREIPSHSSTSSLSQTTTELMIKMMKLLCVLWHVDVVTAFYLVEKTFRPNINQFSTRNQRWTPARCSLSAVVSITLPLDKFRWSHCWITSSIKNTCPSVSLFRVTVGNGNDNDGVTLTYGVLSSQIMRLCDC